SPSDSVFHHEESPASSASPHNHHQSLATRLANLHRRPHRAPREIDARAVASQRGTCLNLLPTGHPFPPLPHSVDETPAKNRSRSSHNVSKLPGHIDRPRAVAGSRRETSPPVDAA